MPLSYDLLSQFAKVVNQDKKTVNESTAYGKVVVDENGAKYVQLDGSDQLTPLGDSSADVNADERVSVLIKNHTATVTGNISSPAARTGDVQNLGDQVTEIQKFDILIGEKIQAQEGYIQNLQADVAEVGELKAAVANVTELVAGKATVEELNAAKAEITDLVATKIDAEVVESTYATIENLEATTAKVGTLEAAHAELEQAVVEDLKAQNAEIANLKAKDAEVENLVAEKASITDLEAVSADVEKLSADYAEVEQLVADKADVKDLEAIDATIKNLDATYANIDFANIGEAAIKKIFSDTGMIKDLVVGDSTITGELVGVTIKGDLIEGNTIKADKLVVKGSDGIYYKLNVEAGGISAEEAPTDSLHGSVITAKSITAEKVSVKDLVAFGATIGGFEITNNAIHSVAKDSANNTTRGIYMDSDGQLVVGDNNNYLKYFRDTDGTYKLDISAANIRLGSSKKTVEEAVNDAVSNINIGGRNLLKNSRKISLGSNNADLFPTNYTEEEENGRKFHRHVRTSTTLNPTRMSMYSGIPLTDLTEHLTGKELTFSFIVRCSHATRTTITGSLAGTSFVDTTKKYDIGTDWKRISVTATIEHDYDIGASNSWLRFNPYEITIPDGEIENFYLDVCEWKIEKGNKATDWTPAPEDVDSDLNTLGRRLGTAESQILQNAEGITLRATKTEVTEAVKNIEVGGRNLLLNSKGEFVSTTDSNYGHFYLAEETFEHGILLKALQPYTLSFDWSVDWGNTEPYTNVYASVGCGGTAGYFAHDIKQSSSMTARGETSGKAVLTFTPSETDLSGRPYFAMRPIRTYDANALDGSVWTIKNLKLEKGNKATDWTPAPEDVDRRISIAETLIEQNAEKIELRATKDEVQAAITTKADEIALTVRQDYDKTASRGEQLVTNGNGMLGDNTNFPRLKFDGSVSNDSPGSFTYATLSEYVVPTSSEFIPINTAKRYTLSFDARSSKGLALLYGYLSFYDVDKQEIIANDHSHDASTLTTLSQDLKTGDTVMYLSDVSTWKRAVLRTRAMIWNYTNSFGYTYPVGTYTKFNPYLQIENSMPTEDAIDYANNTVKLRTAWNGPTIPAGTSVSQSVDGATYKYLVQASGINPPNTWKSYTGSIAGVDYSGGNVVNMFPPGVAYAKVAFLWNLNADDDQLWVTNISLKDTTETNALGSRLTEAESQILQNAEGITLRATKTEVTEAVKNIEVGGRNLVPSSEWICDVTATDYDWSKNLQKVNVEAGETYTLSCYYNGVRTTDLSHGYAYMYIYDSNGTNLFAGDYMSTAQGAMTKTITESNVSYAEVRFGVKGCVPGDVYAVKLEKGNKATDWTPAPEDVDKRFDSYYTKSEIDLKSDAITLKVSNIKVGARNLLLNSHEEVTNSPSSTAEFVQYADLAPIFDKHGLVEYTLSFDLKSADITNSDVISIYCQNGSGSKYYIGDQTFGGHSVSATTEYKRYSITFTPSIQDENETQSILAFYGTYGTGNIPSVKNVKIELGNKATDWTPAPEDVDKDIADAQGTANVAKDIADDAAKYAKTQIEILADQVVTVVTDDHGESKLVQNSNGWIFNTSDLQNRFNELNAYVSIGEYDPGNGQDKEACIDLGVSKNSLTAKITNTRMVYADGENPLVTIDSEKQTMETGVIEVHDYQQFGDETDPNLSGVWQWKLRPNGNLGLSWKGVTS